jgi:hypothetical protein
MSSWKNVMRRTRLALALLTASMAAAGCITPQPKLAKTAAPTAGSGYVGVIFSKDTVTRFGLGIQDETAKHDYVLELENGVSLIDLPPGKYHVTYWVTSAMTGEILTKQVIPSTLRVAQPFDLGGGEVVLLGQWVGERKMGFGSNTFMLTPHPLSQADAAAKLVETYPNFTDTQVSCTMCVP